MMKISLFVLLAVVATFTMALPAETSMDAAAAREADEDSKIEESMENNFTGRAREIVTRLSQIAKTVANLIKEGKFAEIPKYFKEAEDLIVELGEELTDPFDKLVVKYLLFPWVQEFHTLLISGHLSSKNIEIYYALKNSLVEALGKSKNITGNQGAINSQIEYDLAKQLPEPAQRLVTELAEQAKEISKLYEENKIKEMTPHWQKATDIIDILPEKLELPEQKLVVQYLLEPWVKKFLQLLKDAQLNAYLSNFYYFFKNVVLKALPRLEEILKKNE